MKLTAPLLAKIGGGVVVATSLTAVGVVKKDSISSLFVSSSPKATDKLLEHLRTEGKDIVFKAYSGETGKTILNGNFPNFDNKSQTIRFSIETTDSLTGDSQNKTSDELKKLLGTKENLIWECKIEFNKDGNSTTWKDDQKNIFYKTGSGFLQKITASGNKLFKERFIKQCSELSKEKENIVDGSIKLKKQFNLTTKSSNLEITEQEQNDYKSWFGEMELTEKEVSAIKDEWDFSLSENPANTLTLADIKTKDEKISGCKVTLSGDAASSKSNSAFTTLKQLFESDKSVNREKYREGFLKKCRNNENSLTLTLDSSSDLNEKLKGLFDFSRELLKEIYEKFTSFEKVISTLKESKTVKITVIASSNNPEGKYEYKITATAQTSDTNVTFDETSLKTQINAMPATSWKEFLKKHRQDFNDEISSIKLSKATNSEEYDFGPNQLNG